MYKRLLTFLIICSTASYSFAQTYNNEWIDFSKTYYKFSLGPFGYDIVGAPVKAGVVRITQPALVSAGLGNVPAEQFQLWRNGQVVPVYTSVSSGILGPNDYIEFWGEINDGKPDSTLYPQSSFQLSNTWSLQSDTVSYFLTVAPFVVNRRYTNTDNNTASATIQPEHNFIYTIGRYFRAQINPGYAVISTQNLYSSTYDNGEGWTSRPVHPDNCGCSQPHLPQSFPSLFADTTGPAMIARLRSTGNANNDRSLKVSLNNIFLKQFDGMDYFTQARMNIPNIPADIITGDAANFIIQDSSTNNQDEIRVAQITLDYPRLFNFGNASNFEFFLAASDSGRYIKITNFNAGSSTPVLYDISNAKRYTGDVSVPGTVSFLLEPSSKKYHLALARNDGSTATKINSLQNKKFIDFTKISNQGNYLIISNPLIYGSGSSNYVEQYKTYRSSAAGGNFNAKIIDINELVDQFAYGIAKDPLSVKNFLKFARNKFAEAPEYVFLIGKGLSYDAYRLNPGVLAGELNLVPTWGSPGSDNLLSSDDYSAIPATPIGRLSAVSAQEVGVYLQKVKEYEASQKNRTQSIDNKAWTKNVLQLVGADDPPTGVILDGYMKHYKNIISDSLFGANVISFSKTGDPAGYPQAIVNFENIFNTGSGLVSYFGHSSSTALDFNLDNPANYSNGGKYPMFIVNGCLAGNIFDYDVNRLNARSTISEKFVLEPEKGAIGYLATSSFGVSDYLDIFTRKFYYAISKAEYGKGFGDITKYGITKGLAITGMDDFYGRIHAEQYTYHGDPAIKMYSSVKPDYTTDSSQIIVSPDYISVADDSFNVKVRIYNLGKATNDSVHFILVRKYPDGSSETVFKRELPPIMNIDSVKINLPIISNRDKGESYLTAVIDDDNKVSEISDSNNTATKKIEISDADIRPVYPFNFSVVTANTINLFASTADPLAPEKRYIMQMDTTALFNSHLKITKRVTSVGGVIKFADISLTKDSVVYYWRVAADTANAHWNGFSFTHNTLEGKGFQQTHFYQHTQSSFDDINLDTATRKFKFSNNLTNLFVEHSIYPTSGLEDIDFSVSVNGSFVTESACVGSSIIFNVFDTLAFKPWVNTSNPFGAGAICDPTRADNFEYSTQSRASRDSAVKFFDSIPNGDYVLARRIYDIGNADWAPTVWASDTIAYGHNNSLYHRFKSQGLEIDSFIYPRTFIFLFRKNDSANFTPISIFSQGLYDKIYLSQNINTTDTLGYVTSPELGPGKSWSSVTWNGYSLDSNDNVSMDVIGVNKNLQEDVLYTLNKNQQSADISAIDPTIYRFMKLRMKSKDSVTAAPYQLQQWSVQYQPSAEGGIAPNLGISIPDTLSFDHDVNISYDTLSGYVVFKNVSKTQFSKIKLKLVLYDSLKHPHNFNLLRTNILPATDTLHISFAVNVTALAAGKYNLFLQVNPDQDQPEQYDFNNSLYKYIFIQRSTPGLKFVAEPSDQNVLGKWTATNELNAEHYELQHSINTTDFVTVGEVAATEDNIINKNYSLLHTNPVIGKNYYRVKTVNKNGSIAYSSMQEVDFDKDIVMAFPNPFTNQLNISAPVANKKTSVRIMNYTGQQLIQKYFSGNILLDVSKLAAGNYMVIIDDGITPKVFKMQKQK